MVVNFAFNAVLIYYDLYENIESYDTDGTLILTEDVKSTNLFGVLFLDKYRNELTDGWGISRYEKCRPNSAFNLNGNSYGFRLNLKLNINTAQVGVETQVKISDSNTLSMDIFHDTLLEMSKISSNLTLSYKTSLLQEQRLRELEELSLLAGTNSISTLSDKIDQIDTYLNEENLKNILTDKEELVNLIQANYQLLYSILEGKTSLKVAFDLNKIIAGTGIILTTDSTNLIVKTKTNEYEYGDQIYVSKNSWTDELDAVMNYKTLTYTKRLQQFKNYLRFADSNDTSIFIPNANMKLYIDDTLNKWVTGQVMRLYWKTPYNLAGANVAKSLTIYTDAENKFKQNSAYSKIVARIEASEFASRNNTPVIEIHCIDADNYLFEIDFLN